MVSASKNREVFPTGSRREGIEVEDREAVNRNFAGISFLPSSSAS